MRILSFCPRYLPVLSGGETAAHGLHRAHKILIVIIEGRLCPKV